MKKLMNSEVYKNILSGKLKKNISKLNGRGFIMLKDNDPKHPATQQITSFVEKVEGLGLAKSTVRL